MQSGEIPSSKYPVGHLHSGALILIPAQIKQLVGSA